MVVLEIYSQAEINLSDILEQRITLARMFEKIPMAMTSIGWVDLRDRKTAKLSFWNSPGLRHSDPELELEV